MFEIAAVLYLWATRLLWLFMGTYASLESRGEYHRNRQSYLPHKGSGTSKEIISRGRFRRSRFFYWAFLLAALTGWLSVIFLFLYPPPRPDVSAQSATLTLILEAMIFLFWRAKHADKTARKESEAYASRHATANLIQEDRQTTRDELAEELRENRRIFSALGETVLESLSEIHRKLDSPGPNETGGHRLDE